jgi:uncharacterized membrane protein YdjX (TVP38/TMEM64 family)
VKGKILAGGLTIGCLLLTIAGAYYLGGLDPQVLQAWLSSTGVWAPFIYILVYTIGTLFLLPSTPLNLSGGALFGVVWGTVWTTVGAIIAAIISFWFSRTIGHDYVQRKFSQRWIKIDQEIKAGGIYYVIAVRLLPLLPYGLVNFGAGLTSIRFRDYLWGTIIGTTPGLVPFVMMGNGLTAIRRGDLWPFAISSSLIGLSVGTASWYQRRHQKQRK